MTSQLESRQAQMLADGVAGGQYDDDDDSPAPIPDIPHGPTHQRFASDNRGYAGTRSKLSAFLDRRAQNGAAVESSSMLRSLKSSSNMPYGSYVNFSRATSPTGRHFAFPNQGKSVDESGHSLNAPQSELKPLRSLTSMTTGQSWQTTLDQSRRSHKLGLAQLVSRRKASHSSPYMSHSAQPSNAASAFASSNVSTHSLSNRGAPIVPGRLSSLTAQGPPDMLNEADEDAHAETDRPRSEAFESTVPDVVKWFDDLTEPGKGPTTRHKKNRPSQASSQRTSTSRAPSVAPSHGSTFLKEGDSSGSETERSARKPTRRRPSSRGSGYSSVASSRRGSDAYSDRVVVTRRSKLRDSISRQGSVLSTSDSDESDRSRILQIHLPSLSSRSRHHNPTATVFYNDSQSRSHSRYRDDDESSLGSRPGSSRRRRRSSGRDSRPSSSSRRPARDEEGVYEVRPRSSRRRDRSDDVIEISLPRESSRHTNKSRRPSRSSRWAEESEPVPPIPAVVKDLAPPEDDYRRVSDPGPNADYRPPSRQPRHKSSSQNMVAQAVEGSIRQRAVEDPEYLSVTPAEARLLINMRRKKLAMQKQLFSEGYRHALEEELHQLEQMQAKGKASTARVDERSSFASMPDDVGYLGSQFPSPPNAMNSIEERPVITDTIMESPSENEPSRDTKQTKPVPSPIDVPNSSRERSSSRPSTARRASQLPSGAAEVTSPAAAQTPGRTSTSPPSAASPPPFPRANSLTSSAFANSRANSMTSAASASAAARTKSLTSANVAAHNRNSGSSESSKTPTRAVATRQPSWIRRSDEEPLAKFQNQMQAQQQQLPADEPVQERQTKQPSKRTSVDPSPVAESPIHPQFARASPEDAQPSTADSSARSTLQQPIPGGWRDSEASSSQPREYAIRDSTTLPHENHHMIETEPLSASTATARDSGASAQSSWGAASPLTAVTTLSSPMGGPAEHELLDDAQTNKREAAVYTPGAAGMHVRQDSANDSILEVEEEDETEQLQEEEVVQQDELEEPEKDELEQPDDEPEQPDDELEQPEKNELEQPEVEEQPQQEEELPQEQPEDESNLAPDLNRPDTVVRVRERGDNSPVAATPSPSTPSGSQQVYSLFPSALPKPQTSLLQTPSASGSPTTGQRIATPTSNKGQARTAYTSPAGSRSSSRASRLPRMRGSSLPSVPVTTL